MGTETRAAFAERVERIVREIPHGRVATYGQVAVLARAPRAARMVGWVLYRSYEAIPWQRVINHEGRLSIMHEHIPAAVQADLLRREGVAVTERDGSFWVDLRHYLWDPGTRAGIV